MSADPVSEWIQKAEKYLKALLVRRAIAFPKTHDLIQLETLLAPVEPNIGLIHPALALLNHMGSTFDIQASIQPLLTHTKQ